MPLANELFRARLNYQDVKERNPNWDNIMINDYLGIGFGSSVIVEQIDQNTVDISINAENIEENAQLIGSIISRLGTLLSLVSKNSDNIAQNSQDVSDLDLRVLDVEQLVNRV
jgi:hypothetical protein